MVQLEKPVKNKIQQTTNNKYTWRFAGKINIGDTKKDTENDSEEEVNKEDDEDDDEEVNKEEDIDEKNDKLASLKQIK